MQVYDPTRVGNPQGIPACIHDKALVRAMRSTYALKRVFGQFGIVVSARIVIDVVTGQSRGYAFIEFADEETAVKAYHGGSRLEILGKRVLVEHEHGRVMSGWVPRRLGGGLGGTRSSGQMRFGGRMHPFRGIHRHHDQSGNDRNTRMNLVSTSEYGCSSDRPTTSNDSCRGDQYVTSNTKRSRSDDVHHVNDIPDYTNDARRDRNAQKYRSDTYRTSETIRRPRSDAYREDDARKSRGDAHRYSPPRRRYASPRRDTYRQSSPHRYRESQPRNDAPRRHFYSR